MDQRYMAPDVAEIVRLAEVLVEQRSTEDQRALHALAHAARSIGVPTGTRRDDAPVFIAGTEPIETATWTQCGGLLFALLHDHVPDARDVAERVARRISMLSPAQLDRKGVIAR
jgi:hypothetical protein